MLVMFSMKVCHGWVICRTFFAGCFSNNVCYWRPHFRNKSVGLGHFVRFVVKFCSKRYPIFCVFLAFLDHTQRRTTVGRTPGRVISSSQRLLPDNTQHSRQTVIHAPGGVRTHNLSRRGAADLRLRPRGHWDRLSKLMRSVISVHWFGLKWLVLGLWKLVH